MYHSVLLFLNIGGPEMILIIFVALLLFGGEKLPEIARGLGKGIRDFKDASEGVKREITNQINNYEEKKAEEKAIQALPPAENTESAGGEHEVANSVPNTMTYVENHPVAEHTTEAAEPVEETKTEPVKNAHE
ncbi:MAG: twin-arginine translocase TatA/TatE family subunit [Bacteroidetes bacterium]|nr:twin-arginine translocase TatA/TatE family subunit [Bacteroidota bacterium]